MQARLDGVDGCVAEGPHGARDEADDGGLPAGQVLAVKLGLPVHEPALKVRVGGKVDGLVGALAQGGEGDAAVEGAEPFLLDDGVEGVGGVAVLGDVERVGHGVALRLQADLDDLHRGDDGDGLGDAGGEAGEEDALARDDARLLVAEHLLVPLERGEADGHLGHDARQHGAEALVEGHGRLLLHNLDARLDEAAAGGAGGAGAARELHADLDGIWAAMLATTSSLASRFCLFLPEAAERDTIEHFSDAANTSLVRCRTRPLCRGPAIGVWASLLRPGEGFNRLTEGMADEGLHHAGRATSCENKSR